MRTNLLALFLVASLCLAGCGSDGSSGNATRTLPPDPGEAGNATVLGVDSDDDGVRDDVQNRIAERYPQDPAAQQALGAMAKSLQTALSAQQQGGTADIFAAADALVGTSGALEGQGGADDRLFVKLQMINTKERGAAYGAFNAALSGQFFAASEATVSVATASVAPAAINPCSQATLTTSVYYSNGVWNDYAGAMESLVAVRNAYQNEIARLYPDERFHFLLAYNYSVDRVRDLEEVFEQKMDEIGACGLNPTQLALLYNDGGSGILTPEQRSVLDPAFYEVAERYYVLDQTNEAYLQKFRSDLLEGRRLLIIAHSQGNLFANRAVATLIEEYSEKADAMGIIGIATPAAQQVVRDSPRFPWFTARDDFVINFLRLKGYPVLDGDEGVVDNDPGLRDPRDKLSNHSFLPSYFAPGLESRAKIDEAFFWMAGMLSYPASELGDGALKVTLEWGPQPDVDLHILEPGAGSAWDFGPTHVYFNNQQGLFGTLDRDDTDGFGPEHYFVACSDLQPGVYRVGVHYYYGFEPESPRVQITTADGATMQLPLRNPLTLQEATPLSAEAIRQIGQIIVGRDDQGRFTFHIEESDNL